MTDGASGDAGSDEVLLQRARTGDGEAFALLYRRHRDAAERLAAILVGVEDAPDLLADATARVWTQFSGGGGPTADFRSYLFTAIRNRHRDALRRRRPEEPSSDQPWLFETLPDRTGTDRVGESTPSGLDGAAATAALATLPESWREVLWQLEVEGYRPAEVARMLTLTPAAVSALAYRAREGLKQAYLAQHLPPAREGSECAWTRQRLGQYVRDQLAARSRTLVARHLRGCESCAGAAAHLGRVNRRLGAVVPLLLLGAALREAPSVLTGTAAAGTAAAGTAGIATGAGVGASVGASAGASVGASAGVGVVATAVVGAATAAVVGLAGLATVSGTDPPGHASEPATHPVRHSRAMPPGPHTSAERRPSRHAAPEHTAAPTKHRSIRVAENTGTTGTTGTTVRVAPGRPHLRRKARPESSAGIAPARPPSGPEPVSPIRPAQPSQPTRPSQPIAPSTQATQATGPTDQSTPAPPAAAPITVTAQSPTVHPITSCDAFGSLDLPATTGVVYTLAQGDGHQGTWTVLARPADGYVLAPGTTDRFAGDLGSYRPCSASVSTRSRPAPLGQLLTVETVADVPAGVLELDLAFSGRRLLAQRPGAAWHCVADGRAWQIGTVYALADGAGLRCRTRAVPGVPVPTLRLFSLGHDRPTGQLWLQGSREYVRQPF